MNNFPIKLAARTARYSNVKRAKISALAFTQSGHLLATAHNRVLRCDNLFTKKYTEHAEEVLVKKLDKLRAFNRFGKITILVLRVNTKGIVMAKPCKRCKKLLDKRNVVVYYSDSAGNIELCA